MKTFQNIVTKGLSGRIIQLVFKQWAGLAYVSGRPSKSKIPATAEQKQTRINFKDAVIHAKRVTADPAISFRRLVSALSKILKIFKAIR